MGNRKLPFGYKMVMGEIVVHPQEAQAVQGIYARYLAGASFNDITDHLKEKGPPYDADKPWNKNMVARILEDSRYTGTDRFPAILDADQMKETTQRRSERMILLSGPAGVGKTRLALESAKIFAESNNCDLKIIRSNGEPIYQDLVAAFPDESNYMVVVDDADQLTGLRHLLELSADTRRQYFIRIIITVRDYAKDISMHIKEDPAMILTANFFQN